MTDRRTIRAAVLLSLSPLAAACMNGEVGHPGGAAGGAGGYIPPGASIGGGGLPAAGGAGGGSAGSGGSGGGGGAPVAGAGGGGGNGSGSAPALDGGAGTGGVMVTDPGKEGDGDTTLQPPYNAPPEATLGPGVTAGKMQPLMIDSKLLAPRMVTVYSPASYVANTPAPFMVMQDGPAYINTFKLNVVLDNMIFKKQLPAMIVIFVPNGGGQRSFEYDSLTDLYTRYVLEEVLPTVEKGLPIKLTTDPEGRAAGGHSSGGIAAFTMGWHRPDQFHRILSNSGSYVGIRGGNAYPGLVMSMPAKPLRVFLSVGTQDQQSPQWQKANYAMAAALAAKSYHYRFVVLTQGTHAQTFPASILPDSLLWLWRGYPIN
jgi:enterochelin esterase family protein